LKRQQARAELEKLHLRTPAEFTPAYSWDEPFPQSVVDLVAEVDLAKMQYNQGLAEVLRVLGW